MTALLIRELSAAELRVAAELTARGMRDNPLDVAAFGANANRRAVRIRKNVSYRARDDFPQSVVLGAFNGASLFGVAATVPSTRCQPSLVEKVMLTPRMLAAVEPIRFARMLRWTSAWAARDVAEAHWHLGPVAVDAHLQGQGIGSALMSEYCERLDRAGVAGYLETDKAENVRFSLKFGFRTVGESLVLNTPNWFMCRDAIGKNSLC